MDNDGGAARLFAFTLIRAPQALKTHVGALYVRRAAGSRPYRRVDRRKISLLRIGIAQQRSKQRASP